MTGKVTRTRRDLYLPGLWVTGVLLFIPLLPNKFIGDELLS